MSTEPQLTPDCDACAALCCLALAFDEGEDFAIDKPAGLPCPKLKRHRCSIHKTLDKEGFSGCAAYDCKGAGQRVTQELFAGRSWRDAPELAIPMMEAFAGMREAQSRLELLKAAVRLPLTREENAIRRGMIRALNPGAPELTAETAADFGGSELAEDIDAFIRSLRHHVMQ